MSTTATTARSVTKTVRIDRPVADVFAFLADAANWTRQVPARVVPNGTGSEFMITFFQPPAFTDTFFDEQTALVDTELATLKQVLESGA
ncbi:hypothetical protein [Streptomyces sp. NPDC050564]|uniref:hypothetical protein n=1 Tax=Streptomyces sp. NPDC050564 TaxID=3365631 RepID=UPI00379446A4